MKAVRFYAKEDVRVEDVPSPDALGDSQVLIKPLTCGICGTDLHEFAGGPIVTPATPRKFTGAVLPQILGHEFSAEVVDVGRNVRRVREGDRISIQPLVMPLDDYYSRRGLNHLSPSMGCIGLSWAWGGMGELAVINDYNAKLIPDNVTDEQGALVEPTAVALYSVDRSGVTGGSTVLVTGAGPIGALVVLICNAVGASKIFVSEPNANRRKHIENLGVATAVLGSKVGQCRRVHAREHRGGCRRGRRNRMFGLRGGAQHMRRRSAQSRHGGADRLACEEGARRSRAMGVEDITIEATWCYEVTMWPRVIRMISSGRLPVEKIVTGRIEPDAIVEKGFRSLLNPSGQEMKVMVNVS
jgi:(R,R)-butanediol dehydrogenase/meso-butanediol dehydrogenase/diacetyl reductase